MAGRMGGSRTSTKTHTEELLTLIIQCLRRIEETLETIEECIPEETKKRIEAEDD